MTTTEELIQERKKTHGDWSRQALLAVNLKDTLRVLRSAELNEMQVEALDMICVKMSRICTGNPYEPDHWDDIAGYAMLGKGGHKE